MKNSVQSIINIILGVAVAVLAYMQFKGNTPTNDFVQDKKIVYVNTDSLLNNYNFYKDTQKEFENKTYNLQVDLGNRERSLQNEVGAIQQRAQAGQMSQVDMQAADLQLKKKGSDLQAYSQAAQQKLAEEQAKRVDQIYNNIRDYIKGVNKANKYEFVLGYAKGGGILYADNAADVTNAIIKGLNDSYKVKAVPAVAKDSTAKK